MPSLSCVACSDGTTAIKTSPDAFSTSSWTSANLQAPQKNPSIELRHMTTGRHFTKQASSREEERTLDLRMWQVARCRLTSCCCRLRGNSAVRRRWGEAHGREAGLREAAPEAAPPPLPNRYSAPIVSDEQKRGRCKKYTVKVQKPQIIHPVDQATQA